VQDKKRSPKSSRPTHPVTKLSISVPDKLYSALVKEQARRQKAALPGYLLTLSDVVRAMLHERLLAKDST
jgi:hypothetical protein